jgi:UDP-N-acetylglucosamine--dolichyl-phosphate N-acetylglucosaminephosphotransferase
MIWIPFMVACCCSLVLTPILACRLRKAGIVGEDVHKADRRQIPEMGGLAIIAAFALGLLVATALLVFAGAFTDAKLISLLAVLATVLLAGLIGVVDDLLGLPQIVKALLPIAAALPLMAVRGGHVVMKVPLGGFIDFGIVYSLVLVPLGVTGAANAFNMVAGFNGLEVGLGLVSFGSLAIIAAHLGQTTSLLILLAGTGALLGISVHNWYPAKVFVGDVGTLTIGATIAAAVIIGDFETAGFVLFLPHAVDFALKVVHGFQKTFGELRDGKLHCPSDGAKSLPQLVMKLTGGIHERSLVLLLMGIQTLFGILAIALYVWW